MTTREFWWVETKRKDGTWDTPEVGQVWRDAKDQERFIVFLPGNECETYPPWVRLIERVAPSRPLSPELPAVGSRHG
ncbi:hypothetical protein [Methylorubrum populi]|jgi:hypothetical protein|uniref:hypothetical protein n=1 Tax=Methylorubrum TaxID=2282523 RepID=UPI001153C11B|nr:hypothetical protein [Methylorubrum populi]QDI82431.1 hypothetical protein E8E01_19415 [Methylorubrum populi]